MREKVAVSALLVLLLAVVVAPIRPASALAHAPSGLVTHDHAKRAEIEEALVLPPTGIDWREWVATIEADGARVPLAFPPGAFIVRARPAFLDAAAAGGARVYRQAVPDVESERLRGPARLAAASWNDQLDVPRATVPTRLDSDGDDALVPPPAAGKTIEPAAAQGAPPGAGFYDTSEFLLGKVAVGIVLPESDGSIDINREDWTTAEITDVLSGVQSALTMLAGLDPNADVSYYVVVHDSMATGYEPIRRGSWTTGEQALWITDCMDSLGFTTGDIFYRTRAYNNALRDSLDTDWAVTMFIVDSSQDTDGRFTDGKFAYAYLGGPFIVMTYDNWTWGIANMNAVAAHEMLHPFYALDEYTGGACTETAGYMAIQNQNQTPSCALDVLCIMRSDLTGAFAADSVCWYTRGQVGWRDTDADSIPDILDTDPTTSLDPSPDTTGTATPVFGGSASVTVLTNLNAMGSGNEITLATVAGVDYRVDGGAWAEAAPSDAAWDEETELYTLTTPPLSEGSHTIEVRARSSVGNTDATPASDTFHVPDLVAPTPVADLVAVARDTTVALYWTNPATADFQSVAIRFRTDMYPSGPADGLLLGQFAGAPGALDSALHAGVLPDTTYYYAAFASDEVPNVAAPDSAVAQPFEPSPPMTLHAPADGSLFAALAPELVWAASDAGAGDTVVAYWAQMASDSLFTTLVVDQEVTSGAPADTSWTVAPPLAEGTRYFLRLRAKDASSGTYGFYSAPFSFSTQLPVDSVAWRPEPLSAWTNFASGGTLSSATDARIEVAFRPGDPLALGGHTGRVVCTSNGGASWDSIPLAWHHTTADTGFFRAVLAFGTHFKHHETVAFRVEGWDPSTVATPRIDDGGYTFVGGPNPIASFHIPSLKSAGPETMRDPLIGNLLDTLYTFEVAAVAGTVVGADLRLRAAASGTYAEHVAAFQSTSGETDFFRTSLDTTFLSEDSLVYYFVLRGSALFDTTYIGGTDDSSFVTVVHTVAEATPFGFRVGTLTSIGSTPGATRKMRLEQNRPNPFNPSTAIVFEVPGARAAHVRLVVFDASGRLVRVLADRVFAPGRHEVWWDGIGDGGSPLSSGTYVYRLDAGGERSARRMTLLR
jgi:hypothetical protein